LTLPWVFGYWSGLSVDLIWERLVGKSGVYGFLGVLAGLFMAWGSLGVIWEREILLINQEGRLALFSIW